jgi:hypothetical protein
VTTALPTIITVIGSISGTLVGAIFAQYGARQRENTAWQRERERENIARQHERVRERERWAREDLNRTFEQRRAAYVEFYESLGEMAGIVLNYELGISELETDKLPTEWRSPTFRKLQHLQIYASRDVSRIASAAYSTCWHWGNGAERAVVMNDGMSSAGNEQLDEEIELLRSAMRFDLGVDVTPMIPLPDWQPASQEAPRG